MALIRYMGGWRPFDFDRPRCPVCGAEITILEIYPGSTQEQIVRLDQMWEYGWIKVQCSSHTHTQDTWDYRRSKEA